MNRNVVIGIVGGLVAVCVCLCVVAGGLIVADPFGWRLIERAQGRYDPLAYAVPADALLYISIDVLQLQSAELKNIIEAFADTPAMADAETADSIKELDQQMEEELGLTFTDDVLPWAGQHAGFFIRNLEVNPSNPSNGDGDLVLLFEPRDTAKAQAFVDKFAQAVGEKKGLEFTTETYQGVTIYAPTEEVAAPLNIAYANGLVLVSNKLEALKAAIDAQKDAQQQLAHTPAFKADLADRSKQYLVYVYIPGAGLKKYIEDNPTAAGVSAASLQSLEAVSNLSFAFSAVKEGVRLDVNMAYDESQLSDKQKQLLQLTPRSDTLKRLPSNTIAAVMSENLALLWEVSLEAAEDAAALKDSMAAFDRQFGFNPSTELFPYLDGELAWALTPDENGLLAQTYAVNLGTAFLAETSQADNLQNTLDTFQTHMADLGAEIDPATLADAQAHALSFGGAPIAVYGLHQGWFGVATSAELFTDLYDSGESLNDNATYTAAWANFPANSAPVMYVDMRSLTAILSESDMMQGATGETVLPYLRPFVSIAIGTTPSKAGIVHSTILVAIQQP